MYHSSDNCLYLHLLEYQAPQKAEVAEASPLTSEKPRFPRHGYDILYNSCATLSKLLKPSPQHQFPHVLYSYMDENNCALQSFNGEVRGCI